MAEALLRRMVEESGVGSRVRVDSAGVAPYARDGALVSLDTRFALRDLGIDVDERVTSTDLKRNLHLLAEADVVLAMTGEQKAIVERMPEAAGKRIATLREFVGEAGDIADPATRDESFFRETCAEIRRCLELAVPKLVSHLPETVR
ncbi:MAG: protein arginine phosphatase [Candidatus Binatota bacterium]|nr:protein arginine phosphatase [Candidatus Binatota bacterium]